MVKSFSQIFVNQLKATLDSGNLISPYRENVPESDRKWTIDQIFNKYFSGIKPKYLSWNHSFSEECHDIHIWTSKLWIGNTYTREYDREDSKEEKVIVYKKAERIYKEDRRFAYRNLADFMAEHGDCWWD